MTTTEMRRSVEAIEQYIKRAQVLLPEDASLLLRFAYRLPAMTSVPTVGLMTDYEAIRAFPAPWMVSATDPIVTYQSRSAQGLVYFIKNLND
jgi:hypothetical protein